MKNIFKKNQIIITALAIMIAIAGYLNFTKDSVADRRQQIDGEVTGQSDYEQYTEEKLLAENSLQPEELDISTYEVGISGTGDLLIDNEDTMSTDTNAEQDTAPGEAVLASTTLSSDYFSGAKLRREQTRSKNREMLMDLIADSSITEEQKNLAFQKIVALAETAEIENATELLLEAKGFEGAVVSMLDESVDVVVDASSITQQQIAQIEDIVMRKTGMDTKNIKVSAVVTQD